MQRTYRELHEDLQGAVLVTLSVFGADMLGNDATFTLDKEDREQQTIVQVLSSQV